MVEKSNQGGTPALPQKREHQNHGKQEDKKFTHFVSIPISTPELQKKYAEF